MRNDNGCYVFAFFLILTLGVANCWGVPSIRKSVSIVRRLLRSRNSFAHSPLLIRSAVRPSFHRDVSAEEEPFMSDKLSSVLSVADDIIHSRGKISPSPSSALSHQPHWLDPVAISNHVQRRHEVDCAETQFAVEQPAEEATSSYSSRCVQHDRTFYEPVIVEYKSRDEGACSHHVLGVISKGPQPLLSKREVDTIRYATEHKWKQQKAQGETTSRFTYQRPGNYEAHIGDLGSHVVQDIVNPLLLNQLYPMVRTHFPACQGPAVGVQRDDGKDQPHKLCVYDALYIRYNATEANLVRQTQNQVSPLDSVGRGLGGAGQPLHRDLGLVSVNIMLNGAHEFQGGGTFFENQLLPCVKESSRNLENDGVESPSYPREPLKPAGVGHVLAHYSSERHAGASTQAGVRDVMVIFITAKSKNNTLSSLRQPPALIQSALLKQCRRDCMYLVSREQDDPERHRLDSILCRISHLRLATALVPTDGEAYLYLGGALMDYANSLAFLQQQQQHGAPLPRDKVEISSNDVVYTALQAAVHSLEVAARLSPCDSRVYNDLAIALTRLSACQKDTHVRHRKQVDEAYRRGRFLLQSYLTAGCDVMSEINSLELNYGLFLANRDDFEAASAVLERVARQGYSKLEEEERREVENHQDRILEDALKLYRFCRSRMTCQ